jgi:hypothetical protein
MKRLMILIPIALVLLISITTANAQRTPALARYRARAVQVNDPSAPHSGYDCFCQAKIGPFDDRKESHFESVDHNMMVEKGAI